jgi:hypothetical protein
MRALNSIPSKVRHRARSLSPRSRPRKAAPGISNAAPHRKSNEKTHTVSTVKLSKKDSVSILHVRPRIPFGSSDDSSVPRRVGPPQVAQYKFPDTISFAIY